MPTSAILTKHLQEMRVLPPAISKDYSVYNSEFKDKPKIYLDKCKIVELANDLQILKTTQTNTPNFSKKVPENNFHLVADYYDSFLQHFCDAHVSSIDSYLANLKLMKDSDRYQIYTNFGKLTITYFIFEYEKKTHLGARDHSWIHFMINEFLLKSMDKFFKNPPKVITFNYDRVLEKILFDHLIHQHHISEAEALDKINSLDILHIYGSLGGVNTWFSPNDYIHKETYQNAMLNIKVIGEDRIGDYKSEISHKINKKLESTQNIYFLGYGFDEINNSIIKGAIDPKWQPFQYYSTCHATTNADLIRIKRSLIDPAEVRQFKTLNKVDCKRLISEEAPMSL
jgi:hypothetical protein